MSELTLPAVAKSFYTFCKKCDIDRYHRVLAHTSPTTAKIECEVCHSRKSYSLPKPGTVAKRLAQAGVKAGARKTSHTGEYEIYNQKHMSVDATKFNIKSKFKQDQKIDHPKFGIGFVQKVYVDKIDVIFAEEVKSLVHNRV